MKAGAEMFLLASTEPETQQIVLLDGPSVLGWDRWREIATEHGLGLIEATLQAAVEAGEIDSQPVRPLAHVLMGALDEAAMLVARAEDPERMRAEVGADARRPARRPQPRLALIAGSRLCAVGARSVRTGGGGAARLLLRVHAHVGELQRRRGIAGLGRDRRGAPGGADLDSPVVFGQRFGRGAAPPPRSGPRRR